MGKLLLILGAPYLLTDNTEHICLAFRMDRMARVVTPGIPQHLTQRDTCQHVPAIPSDRWIVAKIRAKLRYQVITNWQKKSAYTGQKTRNSLPISKDWRFSTIVLIFVDVAGHY